MSRNPLICALLLSLTAMPAAAGTLTQVSLPASVAYPEGVAYDPASHSLYTGSAVDGALVRVEAGGAVAAVAPGGQVVKDGGAFPAMLGMKVDAAGRLWIAGGRTGQVSVVDPATGRVLKQDTVATAPKSLLNDLVVIGNSTYVTDTFVPTLWRVTAQGDAIGAPEPWLDLNGTAIVYGEGPNLNGIAATADGRTLIVVQMKAGKLFRIDIATKAVTAIDTGTEDLSGSDGLVLDGNTLFIVRQWAGEIVTVALDDGLTQGTVTGRFSDPGLMWPATAAKAGDHLVVVNSQFNRREGDAATKPFSLVKVPLALLKR